MPDSDDEYCLDDEEVSSDEDLEQPRVKDSFVSAQSKSPESPTTSYSGSCSTSPSTAPSSSFVDLSEMPCEHESIWLEIIWRVILSLQKFKGTCTK